MEYKWLIPLLLLIGFLFRKEIYAWVVCPKRHPDYVDNLGSYWFNEGIFYGYLFKNSPGYKSDQYLRHFGTNNEGLLTFTDKEWQLFEFGIMDKDVQAAYRKHLDDKFEEDLLV